MIYKVIFIHLWEPGEAVHETEFTCLFSFTMKSILVFLQLYEVDEDDNEEPTRLSFVVPRDQASGFINNKKEEYAFRFEKVFEQKTKQDEIFEYVARDVVDKWVILGFYLL